MVPALLSPASRSGIDVIAGGAILLHARCALLARWTRRQTYMCAKNSPDFAMKSGLGVSFRVLKVTSAAYDRSVYLSERDGRIASIFWRKRPAHHSRLALPTFVGPQPRFSGTAKNFCHPGPTRRSRLALPRISATRAQHAAHGWHCQEFLPPGPRAPLTAGTASTFWRPGPAF